MPAVEDLSLRRLVRIDLAALNIHGLIDVCIWVFTTEEPRLCLSSHLSVNLVLGSRTLAFSEVGYLVVWVHFETVSGRWVLNNLLLLACQSLLEGLLLLDLLLLISQDRMLWRLLMLSWSHHSSNEVVNFSLRLGWRHIHWVLNGSRLHLVLLSLLRQLIWRLHYYVLLRGVDPIRRYWRVIVGLNDRGRHALMSILVWMVVQRNPIRVLLF